jgi:hypothetical protein
MRDEGALLLVLIPPIKGSYKMIPPQLITAVPFLQWTPEMIADHSGLSISKSAFRKISSPEGLF